MPVDDPVRLSVVERMIEDMDTTEGAGPTGSIDVAAVLGEATRRLTGLAAEPQRVTNADVTALMAASGALAVALDSARVALTREAVERGLVGESGAASPVDWVLAASPASTAGEAKRVVAVADAGRSRDLRPVAEAVLEGRLPLTVAQAVLAEYGRLAPQLTPEAAPAVLDGMVSVGCDHGIRAVRELRTRIVARYGREGALDREQATLARMRALTAGRDDGSGMLDYLLRLDPEAAETLEAALSPLAAPEPSAEAGPDLRSSHQRRADALIEMVSRAVASAPGVPVTTKASVVVTIDFDTLRGRLEAAGATAGPATGAGTTATGGLLAPHVVRRLACDASVLPVVLGSSGEVLDVGRDQRLVTPRLLKTLWVRDGGCTYPGCSRPPGWCHAHHVRHWARGGRTDLDNLALLCARHHTHVHARDLTATVGPTGVTWHTGTGPPRRC